MRYKLSKFYENHAKDTPLRGVYIPHFNKISVKISLLLKKRSYTLTVAPIGVEFRNSQPKPLKLRRGLRPFLRRGLGPHLTQTRLG